MTGCYHPLSGMSGKLCDKTPIQGVSNFCELHRCTTTDCRNSKSLICSSCIEKKIHQQLLQLQTQKCQHKLSGTRGYSCGELKIDGSNLCILHKCQNEYCPKSKPRNKQKCDSCNDLSKFEYGGGGGYKKKTFKKRHFLKKNTFKKRHFLKKNTFKKRHFFLKSVSKNKKSVGKQKAKTQKKVQKNKKTQQINKP